MPSEQKILFVGQAKTQLFQPTGTGSKSNGNWQDEETIVREVNRDTRGTPKKDGEKGFLLNELLEEQYIPAHIAPFFFFDGEEVKKLADQSRIEQVKQGLEGLLGVVLVRNLAERLKTFEDSKRSSLSNLDEANLQRLEQTLKADQQNLVNLKNQFISNSDSLTHLKAERTSLLDRIVAAGGGGGEIATVKDLAEEREQYRTQFKANSANLSKILADKLPFYLVPSKLLNDFKEQILGEISLAKWQTEYRTLQPKRQKFFDELLLTNSPPFSPELTESQLKALEARIETAWSSLFLPPPPNCADENVHDYLHDELKQRAIRFLNSLAVGRKEVQTLINQKNELEANIEDVNRRISRVEGIDRDGTLAELKVNMQKINDQIDALESSNGDIERQITSLESVIHQTKAKVESERQRRDATSPDRSLIDRSERVRKVIDEVVPELFPLKVRQLANSMTKVYKQLAHKTQVAKISIDSDGTTHILSANGKELNFDRSAGENQIFATALIAGLAEVSKVDAPLVVDTPLGRLDSKHRENIFGFWTSDQDRQVILLSQDEEISPQALKKIKSHVCKTYLLKHTEVGDGIGRTSAIADKYFGDH